MFFAAADRACLSVRACLTDDGMPYLPETGRKFSACLLKLLQHYLPFKKVVPYHILPLNVLV